MRPGIANRTGLDRPSLTPPDEAPGKGTQFIPGTGTPYGDNANFATGPDGTRTMQMPLAPGAFQEQRVMIANRAAAVFTPGAVNMNSDPQKGGSPGGGPNTSYTTNNVITSESPAGVTTTNGVPVSQRKLAYGWSDYAGHYPTFVGAHLKIQWNANPNKPQLNPTPFNTEGPSMNTKYNTPAPFAAGTFIG
jgi:hypothetical protein